MTARRRRVRVLLVTRPGEGGAARHVELICRHHDRARVDLSVLASPLEDPSYLDVLRATGVPVTSVPIERHVAPVADTVAFARILARLAAGSYDVVHLHTSKPGILGRLAGVLAATPRVVYTPHGFYYTYFAAGARRRLFLELERGLARLGSRTLTLSAAEQDAASAMAPGRARLIPNAIAIPEALHAREREQLRRELGAAPAELLAVQVGRIEAPKEPEVAIEAAAELRRRGVPVHVAIVGDGSGLEALRILARDVAPRGTCTFTGARSDAARLLAAADVALLCSRSEGLPYVLLEAAAAGVPAVATDLPGCREVVVDHQTGFTVPPGDPVAVADCIERLHDSPDLRQEQGARARARIQGRFGIASWIETLMQEYEGKSAHP